MCQQCGVEGIPGFTIIYSVNHYSDVILIAVVFQIIGVSIVCSSVCSDQRKHQSSASLVFVRGKHRWPLDSRHKRPVLRKMFPFDDVIVYTRFVFLFLWTMMISDTLIFIWAWYGIFHSLQGKQFALLSSITTENNIKLKCFNIRLRTHLRFGVLSNGFIDGNGTAVIIAQQHSAMRQNQLLPATTRTRFNSGTRWHAHRGMYKTLQDKLVN